MSKKPTPTSTAIENYLKVIYAHTEWQQNPINASKLATKLNVSPASVSEMIKKLTELNYVIYNPYISIKLTKKGETLALKTLRKHRLLELYLVEELQYSWDQVHAEAEILEHAISNIFLEKINKKLGNPNRDPHGDPIPNKHGKIKIPKAQTLSTIQIGTKTKIVRIEDKDPKLLRYFNDINLKLDTTIQLTEKTTPNTLHLKIFSTPNTYQNLNQQHAEKIWVNTNQQN